MLQWDVLETLYQVLYTGEYYTLLYLYTIILANRENFTLRKFQELQYCLMFIYINHHTGSCLQGSFRLVGPNGPSTIEGRVEYCSNGVWGTVSSYWFGSRDGEVACRRLGHQHPRESSTCIIVKVNGMWFIAIICKGDQRLNGAADQTPKDWLDYIIDILSIQMWEQIMFRGIK